MAKQTEKLDEIRVADLREKAKEAGVTGTSHMRKDDLIDALSDAQPKSAQSKSGKQAAAPEAGQDAIELLIADHATVKTLFAEALEKEDGDESIQQLAQQIVMELTLHTEAEEQIFYPALKQKAIDAEEDDAKDEVLEAYVEHGSVKELIAKIEALDPSDESYKAIVQVMSEQVEHHVEEEEGEMFKQARQLLDKNELIDLGQQIMTFKESAKASAA